MTRFLPALVAAALVAGCANSSPQEDSSEQLAFGLGLELSSPFPPENPFDFPARGPFLEGNETVAELRANLENLVPEVIEACGGEYNESRFQKGLESSILFAAVHGSYGLCRVDLADARALAKGAADEGRVNETYETYLQQAWEALERQAKILDAAPTGSTVAEVEFVAKVMAQITFRISALQGAERAFNAYWNSTRDPLAFGDVMLNLMGPPADEIVTRMLIQQYPWGSGKCAVDEEALVDETRSKLNRTLTAGAAHSTPDEKRFVNYPYGSLLKDTIPALDFMEPRGWWQAQLTQLMLIEHYLAYFDTYNGTPLPTQPEAYHLVVQYDQSMHSLATEDRVRDLYWQMLYEGRPWDDDVVRARLALSLEKMPWTFDRVQCNP